jgi:flagellar secretion chaperone FliS
MSSQYSHYLESKVLTAPPHRLHLMLIDGALRFGRQAADALARGDHAAAAEPLMRVVDIVGELLAGVRGGQTPISDRLTKLYWFLFRRVSEAKIRSDAGKLAEALQLLEYERDTWQLACDQIAQVPPPKRAGESSEPHSLAETRLSLEA